MVMGLGYDSFSRTLGQWRTTFLMIYGHSLLNVGCWVLTSSWECFGGEENDLRGFIVELGLNLEFSTFLIMGFHMWYLLNAWFGCPGRCEFGRYPTRDSLYILRIGGSQITRVRSSHLCEIPYLFGLPKGVTIHHSFSGTGYVEAGVAHSGCRGFVVSKLGFVAMAEFSNKELVVTVPPQEKPFTLWPGKYHSPVTAALWHAKSSFVERARTVSVNSPAQTKLQSKTPAENRTSVLYNFSSDPTLREEYRNPWNSIRVGKLLEDLDALAGTIAVKVSCQSIRPRTLFAE